MQLLCEPPKWSDQHDLTGGARLFGLARLKILIATNQVSLGDFLEHLEAPRRHRLEAEVAADAVTCCVADHTCQ